jgi:peptidylprolyl isomerase
MFNTFELISFSFAIVAMATALYLLQVSGIGVSETTVNTQPATAGIIVVGDGDETAARAAALLQASTARGQLRELVVDDIKIGTGDVVKVGDTVSVHYIGTLQSGVEFDNSRKRGTPFEFTVGAGRVIPGWEEGIVGMQVGGQRILVIPADKAYGNQQVGPIPPNSTLVFAIELLEIK